MCLCTMQEKKERKCSNVSDISPWARTLPWCRSRSWRPASGPCRLWTAEWRERGKQRAETKPSNNETHTRKEGGWERKGEGREGGERKTEFQLFHPKRAEGEKWLVVGKRGVQALKPLQRSLVNSIRQDSEGWTLFWKERECVFVCMSVLMCEYFQVCKFKEWIHLSSFSSRVCAQCSIFDESVCVCRQGCACVSAVLYVYLLWRVNMHVCVCLSCHVALCVGVSVDLRSLTRTPPLRGPQWLRWVSTHGVHGLDHSCCCGDVGSLLLQAVGLLVDRLYLDVWFTEGDTPPTWKKSTTFGWIFVKQNPTSFCLK